jgi:hypothetical protein
MLNRPECFRPWKMRSPAVASRLIIETCIASRARIQQKLVEAAGKNGKPTLLQPEVLMPGSPAASSMLDTLRRAQRP